MAAVKKRYGTSRKPIKQDLQTAEEVQEKLEGVWLKLEQYRYPILGAFGLLFVLVVAVSLVDQASEESAMEANNKLNAVMTAMNAPVFEEGAPEGFEGLSFETDEARIAATEKAAGEFAAASDDVVLNAFAQMAVSNVQYEGGNFEAAVAANAKVQTGVLDTSLQGAVSLKAAITALAAGDRESAKAGFTQALGSGQPFLQIQGFKGLGDLSNAAFGGTGNVDDAKGQYEKAIALLDQLTDKTTQDALRADLEGRLNTL